MQANLHVGNLIEDNLNSYGIFEANVMVLTYYENFDLLTLNYKIIIKFLR